MAYWKSDDAPQTDSGNGSHYVKFEPKLSKKSLILRIKNLLNEPMIKQVVGVGSEIASAFSSYSENPSLWSGLKGAFLVGKTLVENFEVQAYDYFEDESKWVEPFSRDFCGAILKVLRKFPYETLKTSTEGSVIHLVKLNSGTVGWVTHTSKNSNWSVHSIYAESEKLKLIRDEIKVLLWEQYKDKPLVLRKNLRSLRSFDEDRVVLEVDTSFSPLPSALATEYTTYLKKALDGGVNRSVMLYGPPGTGKSTTARTLVNNLKLRSFRLRIEDVEGIDNSTLFEAMDIFMPEAIILDDFDRARNQEVLLETLEHFEKNVKLVVATVNKRDSLDEALLRPGRFDELVLVKRMDDNVIRKVLGDYVEDFDKVKDWPIAFIDEYVKRRRFMSNDEAINTIKELAERVERLAEYEEPDALSTVLGRKSTRGKRVLAEGEGGANPLDDGDDDGE